MRKGFQINIVKDAKSYTKPPPSPLYNLSGSRMRLHSHDSNEAPTKDRLGCSQDHLANVGSSMPVSPSHLASSRERSPKDASQILHDCSMCIAAYIQSLNTVCGTACRLAQCLAQIDLDKGSNEASAGSGPPLQILLKDTAELWEGIARIVGMASSTVKNQMFLLLQDAQAKKTMEYSDSTSRAEFAKIMRTILSSFVNLQWQFSFLIVERFSGIVQQLKDDSEGPSSLSNDCCSTSANLEKSGQWPSDSTQHYSNSCHSASLASTQSLQHQLIAQQYLSAKHQNLLQQAVQPPNKHSLTELSYIHNEKTLKQHGSCSIPSSLQTTFQPAWLVGQPSSGYYVNTLSPGLYSTEEIGTLNENLARRWSMGCGTALEEGCLRKLNSLDPFSIIANRRWSVPETTEYDPFCSRYWDFYPYYHYNYSESFSSGKNSHHQSCNKENFKMISRESSCTRSPSHSRSVTPDQSRRVSMVSCEELQDIIDLLSISLNDEKKDILLSPSPGGGKGFAFNPVLKDELRNGFPSKISETEVEPNLLLSSDQLNGNGAKPFWLENCYKKVDSESHSDGEERTKKEDSVNQICTSLWPPTDSVPGVTLTTCVGEVEKRSIPPWAGCDTVEGCSREESDLNNGSISRASWPISSLTSFSNDMSLNTKEAVEEWPSRPFVSTFRRHSTDAPYYLPHGLHHHHSSFLTKTRSFENLAGELCRHETK